MKFTLVTSGTFYRDSEIDSLEDLGFKFKIDKELVDGTLWCMNYEQIVTIEINTLDDLFALIEKTGSKLIIHGREDSTIEIYDDYRE